MLLESTAADDEGRGRPRDARGRGRHPAATPSCPRRRTTRRRSAPRSPPPSSAPASATARESLAKPLPIEVDRVRARFSSWYELFPRSWGGLKAVEEQIPAIAEHGFDVLYFPPIHPIGRKNRKGRNNTLVAGPDDPGVAVRDRRRRGRARRRPPRARHDGRPALAVRHRARARHGRGARPRAQRLRRPPVADRAPRVVPPPPRRHDQVRREPAQEVPGHLQLQLGHAGLEGAVGGVAADRALLGRRRREGLPRRQPAHEAVPVLGVADQGGPRRRPRRDLPRARPSRGAP